MKISHKLHVRVDGTQFLLLWWFTAKNEGGNHKWAWVYYIQSFLLFSVGVQGKSFYKSPMVSYLFNAICNMHIWANTEFWFQNIESSCNKTIIFLPPIIKVRFMPFGILALIDIVVISKEALYQNSNLNWRLDTKQIKLKLYKRFINFKVPKPVKISYFIA